MMPLHLLRVNHLGSVPATIAAYLIGGYLLDTDAERWARCSHQSLQQLRLYHFKGPLSVGEAIRLAAAAAAMPACTSPASRAACLGSFGQAVDVWTSSDGDLSLLSHSQLPASVKRMCVDHTWPRVAGQLVGTPATITELYCASEQWSTTDMFELAQLLQGCTRLKLFKVSWTELHFEKLQQLLLHFPRFLPESLVTLVLGDTNIPLPLELPASITDLRLPRFSQPATDWPQLPPRLRVLHCDHDAPVGELTLPASLTELQTFWYDGTWRAGDPRDSKHLASWSPPNALTLLSLVEFNEPASTVRLVLPSTLRTLSLPRFQHALDAFPLPNSLTELTISADPSHVTALNRMRWPAHLHTLCFGPDFSLPLRDWCPPSALTSLDLGGMWNLPSSQLCLPRGLRSLRLSRAFNESLEAALQPLLCLTDLHLGDKFNQPLLEGHLPPNLLTLTLSREWQLPLSQLRLPASLRLLRLGPAHPVIILSWRELELPQQLNELDLEQCVGNHRSPVFADIQLPPGLVRLRLPSIPLRSKHQLPSLPAGLRELCSPPNARLRDWMAAGRSSPVDCVLLDYSRAGQSPFVVTVPDRYG